MKVTCKRCKFTKSNLPFRSQMVTCARCGAVVRVSVTFRGKESRVAITAIDPPESARVKP